MANKLEFMFKLAGVDDAARQLKKLDSVSTEMFGKKSGVNVNDWLKAAGGNFSTATISKNKAFFEALGQQSGQAVNKGFAKAIKSPPVIADFQAQMRKNILGGLISAPFSPYLASRGLASGFRGLTGGGGGGGGGRGGIGGMGASGGILAIAAAFVAIKLAGDALRMAFNELKDAIKNGAKLYTDAAKVGRSPTALFHLQSALGQVGISGDQAEQMMMGGQFPQTSRTGMGRWQQRSRVTGRSPVTQVGGIPLGGQGMAGLAEMQQMRNLSKDIQQAWRDSALDAAAMGQSARELFEIQYSLNDATREFKTMWAQMATLIGPFVKEAFKEISAILKVINIELMQYVHIMQMLGIISKGKPTEFKQAATGTSKMPAGEWQRMGFIMRGQPDQQVYFLRMIARNTEGMARAFNKFTTTGDITTLFGGINKLLTNYP